MTRRADPIRIYAARRAGLLRRLVDERRINELEAEDLIVRWEAHAGTIGLQRDHPAFWDDAWPWVLEQHSARNR